MNMGKIVRGVKAASEIAQSKNPGETAGKMVAAAVTVAHPIAGAIGAKPIAKATEKIVNKGIAIAKDPKVQAKAKEVATNIGNASMSAARRGFGAATKKLNEFRAGHGK